MRERNAGCIPSMASRFPAAIMIKLHGAGYVLTSAPELRSDCPVIAYSFSCSAVSRLCWDSGRRILISSMKRTPLCALWMSPDSTRSCDGVSSPPDWNGSCRTSPRSAPECAPVASTNGAVSLFALFTISFGMSALSPCTNCLPMTIINRTARIPHNRAMPPRDAA